MMIDSITTSTATVGAALIRVASRVLLSLTHWMFVALVWIALALVGIVMLMRWSWKPVRRSAIALTAGASVTSRSIDSSVHRVRRR